MVLCNNALRVNKDALIKTTDPFNNITLKLTSIYMLNTSCVNIFGAFCNSDNVSHSSRFNFLALMIIVFKIIRFYLITTERYNIIS